MVSLSLTVLLLQTSASVFAQKYSAGLSEKLNTIFCQAPEQTPLPGINGLSIQEDRQLLREYTTTGSWERTNFEYQLGESYEDRKYVEKGPRNWFVRYYPKTVQEFQVTKTYRIVNREAFVINKKQEAFTNTASGLGTASLAATTLVSLFRSLIHTENPQYKGMRFFCKAASTVLALSVVSGIVASSMAAKAARAAPAVWQETNIQTQVKEYHPD